MNNQEKSRPEKGRPEKGRPVKGRETGCASATCCDGSEDDAALLFKALGHPVRLRILQALAMRGSCCCGDVCAELPLAQSTVSQHLDLLRKAGLVHMRPDGTRSAYRLDRQAFDRAAAVIAELGGAGPEGDRP